MACFADKSSIPVAFHRPRSSEASFEDSSACDNPTLPNVKPPPRPLIGNIRVVNCFDILGILRGVVLFEGVMQRRVSGRPNPRPLRRARAKSVLKKLHKKA